MRIFTQTWVLVFAMIVGVKLAYAVVYDTVGTPATTSQSVNISCVSDEQRVMECDRVIDNDDSPGTDNNDNDKSSGRDCVGRFSR